MRICATTGLALVEEEVTGYRITKTSFGPLNPRERRQSEDRSGWSRFDTAGRTIYIADTARTAYLETLSPARVGADFSAAAQFAADFFGVPLAQAEKDIQDEWAHNGHMVPGWLPASWRDGRLMYELQVLGTRSWVDMDSAETIAALNRAVDPPLWIPDDATPVTLGVLTGENRAATTAIAQWIRQQILDDGTYPAGIRFPSKFGGGVCWAYWMRRTDDGLGADPISELSSRSIDGDDADLQYVLELYGAHSR